MAAWSLSDPAVVPPVGPLVEGRQTIEGPFTDCHRARSPRCVVDGDTIRLDGQAIRLVGYNTPEYSDAQCPYERALAEDASAALLELLSENTLVLVTDRRDTVDRYGRPLRTGLLLADNGETTRLADAMIALNLAEPYWGGQRRDWC